MAVRGCFIDDTTAGLTNVNDVANPLLTRDVAVFEGRKRVGRAADTSIILPGDR